MWPWSSILSTRVFKKASELVDPPMNVSTNIYVCIYIYSFIYLFIYLFISAIHTFFPRASAISAGFVLPVARSLKSSLQILSNLPQFGDWGLSVWI